LPIPLLPPQQPGGEEQELGFRPDDETPSSGRIIALPPVSTGARAGYGRWAIGTCGCGCGPCNITATPTFCTKNLEGVTVTITTTGGSPVASGVTGSGGQVVLNIGAAGTYTCSISYPGLTTVTQNKALTCGGPLGMAFALPLTLSLTDSDTTITLNNSFTGECIWIGCYELAGTSPTATFSGGVCTVNPGGNCDIVYQVDFGQTGPGWNVYREWGGCCRTGTPTIGYYSSSGVMNLTTCTGQAAGIDDTGSSNPSVISFPTAITMTLASGICNLPNAINSPLGSGVSIDV
jgi:hypothetical protein